MEKGKMTPEERDDKVAKFITSIIQSIPYYVDNEIMESFDVKFEYGGKQYQLALIQDGKVNGKDFKLNLN